MSRKFIGAVLAASLTITAIGTAPARADNQEVLRFLGTAAALALIGKAIADHNEKERKKPKANVTVSRPGQYRPEHRRHDDHDRKWNRGRWKDDRPYSHRDPGRPGTLPANCLQRIETDRNTRYVFPQWCLEKHYRSARPLPQDCSVAINREGRITKGYGLNCLRKRGYEVASR